MSNEPADAAPAEKPLPPAKKQMPGWIIPIVIVMAILYLVMVYQKQTDGPKHPAVGKKLTEFRVSSLRGDTTLELSQLRGKVVLINYWGTWCPPCRVEMPHLLKLAEEYKDEPLFEMVSVSCPSDPNEPLTALATKTEQYLASQNADIAVYADPTEVSRRELAKLTEMEGFSYPTTVILDRDHTVRGIWLGYSPGVEKEMERTVRGLLTR